MARKIIWSYAYRDHLKSEIVNRLSKLDIINMLGAGEFSLYQIPNVERGEVLVDSRGKGSFQQHPKRG
jgi:hypothetical protein